MNTREQVRAYVTKVLRDNKDDTAPLADSDSLVLSGRFSSLDVIDVLSFLESAFGFAMDPINFDQETFDSVNSIVALVDNEAGANR